MCNFFAIDSRQVVKRNDSVLPQTKESFEMLLLVMTTIYFKDSILEWTWFLPRKYWYAQMAGNAHCHSWGGKPLVPMLSALKGSSANQQLDSQ